MVDGGRHVRRAVAPPCLAASLTDAHASTSMSFLSAALALWAPSSTMASIVCDSGNATAGPSADGKERTVPIKGAPQSRLDRRDRLHQPNTTMSKSQSVAMGASRGPPEACRPPRSNDRVSQQVLSSWRAADASRASAPPVRRLPVDRRTECRVQLQP